MLRDRWALVGLVVGLSALGCSNSEPDPIATKCAPHRKRELECADAEGKRGLEMIGDLCQKVLNGKNSQIFTARDQVRMEAELACAIAAKDCAAYTACREHVHDDASAPTP